MVKCHRSKMVLGLLAVLVVFGTQVGNSCSGGGQNDKMSADEKQIRQSSENFRSAFQKGNVKAIAAMWTANGEYITDDGVTLRGHKEIATSLTKYFKENDIENIEIKIDNIRFPSKNTAVEEGFMRVKTKAAKLASVVRYSVLHAREDGTWRWAIVREWGGVPLQSKLSDLNWLVGSWRAKAEDREIVLGFQWDKNKTFLHGRFVVKEGAKTTSGMRIIGRDPVDDVIRSWTFLSDGGYGHGVWLQDGKRWTIESGSKLADGSQSWSTNLITKLSNDAFVFHSIDRKVDSVELPDTQPVRVNRIKKGK